MSQQRPSLVAGAVREDRTRNLEDILLRPDEAVIAAHPVFPVTPGIQEESTPRGGLLDTLENPNKRYDLEALLVRVPSFVMEAIEARWVELRRKDKRLTKQKMITLYLIHALGIDAPSDYQP